MKISNINVNYNTELKLLNRNVSLLKINVSISPEYDIVKVIRLFKLT